MSLGYDAELNVVNLGDTAILRAFLYHQDDQPYTADELNAVEFTIQSPDRERVTQDGTINEDGVGIGRFDDTTQIGQYVVVASFTTIDGRVKSTRCDFEVKDPFKDDTPSQSYIVAVAAWAKIEDCFDAEDEGPWLQDETLNFFNKDKMESFIAEALYDINFQNPMTALTIDTFVLPDGTETSSLPLLAEAVFICVLRHLIRSYTEQPNPVGSQIAWQDRRDYLQRWQSVYQIELAQYQRMLALFKRQFLGLGGSAILMSSKAGRLMTGHLRTRYAGRGFYW